jgi:hypothetical protein
MDVGDLASEALMGVNLGSARREGAMVAGGVRWTVKVRRQ